MRALRGVENRRIRMKLYQNIRTAFEVNKSASSRMSDDEKREAVVGSFDMLELLQQVGHLNGDAQTQLLANWRDSGVVALDDI